MIWLINFLLIFFGGTLNSSTQNADSHALYIGVIEINHPEQAENANILIKVFSDDLMNALINNGNKELKTEEVICAEFSEGLEAYFNAHFIISFDDSPLSMNLLDCTGIADSHWLEFEISCPPTWSTLDLKADFFMELFPTQSNMITLIEGDKRSFYRSTKGRDEFKVILR